jgi:hypothetical protein
VRLSAPEGEVQSRPEQRVANHGQLLRLLMGETREELRLDTGNVRLRGVCKKRAAALSDADVRRVWVTVSWRVLHEPARRQSIDDAAQAARVKDDCISELRHQQALVVGDAQLKEHIERREREPVRALKLGIERPNDPGVSPEEAGPCSQLLRRQLSPRVQVAVR